MLDRYGVQLEVNDIITVPGNDGPRFARAVVLGHTDSRKRTPVLAAIVFDVHGGSANSWLLINDADTVQRASGELHARKMEELVRLLPNLSGPATAEQVGVVNRAFSAFSDQRALQLA